MQAAHNLVSIGEAKKLLGISIDTLRRWEKKGLVKALRSSGGHRRYQKAELLRLKNKQTSAVATTTELEFEPIRKLAADLVNPQAPVLSDSFNSAREYLSSQAMKPFAPIAPNETPIVNNPVNRLKLSSLILAGAVALATFLIAVLVFPLREKPPPPSTKVARQVLAATTARPELTIDTDTAINGSLVVNGATISALPQGLTPTDTPSFASLILTAPTNQIVVNDYSLTIDASGTLALVAATQTLTNKTLSGSSNTFTNIPNAALENATITINTSGNLSGGGEVELGDSLDLSLTSSPTFTSLTVSGTSTLGSVSLNSATVSGSFGIGGVASLSGGLTFDGTAQIDATNNRPLRLGFNTTGAIQFLNSSNYIDSSGNFYLNGIMVANSSGLVVSQYFQRTNGLLTPSILTDSLNLGTTASSSALTHLAAISSDSTFFMNLLGVGTRSPRVSLDVLGQSGTLAVASIAGSTAQAALVVDNSVGDLFTASSSGLTRLVIDNQGVTTVGRSTGSSLTPQAKLQVRSDFPNGLFYGIDDVSNVVGATSTVTSGHFRAVDSTSETISFLTGIYAQAGVNAGIGTGVVENAYGAHVEVTNSTAKIRNAYGLYLPNAKATGSDVGQTHNAYGIYIGTGITASGGDTNNAYSIYSASTANSYLAGNIGIGTTNPSSFVLQTAGSIGPNADDTYDLGSNGLRWQDLYLGPGSLHVGTSTSDEGLITYNTTTNDTHISSTGDLVLQGSGGNVGIGIATPSASLEIQSANVAIPALQLRAAVGQTANLFNWTDSSGNVQGYVNSAGQLILANSQTTSGININQAIGGIDYNVFSASSSGTVSITQRNAELGTGADGNCTVSSTVTNDTGTCVGRANADAVNFRVTSDVATGAATITVSSTPTGLAVGDEILIINLRDPNNAGSAYYSAGDWTNAPLGKYETRYITAINTNTLTLNQATTNFYPAATHNYDVVVQRVPQYGAVTVNNGGTYTTTAFSTSTHKGGVIFFRATGNVTVASGGSISASGKGYLGGTGSGGTGGVTYNGVGGTGGNGIAGTSGSGGGGGNGTSSGSGASGTTGGAGGGGGEVTYAGGGGGGGYASVGAGGGPGNNGGGTAGGDGSGVTGGNGGNSTGTGAGGGGGGGGTYGVANLASLYLGSGGAEGGKRFNGGLYAGGTGGGIVYIAGGSVTVSGGISATGVAGQTITAGDLSGAGGGGAGGSIYIKSSSQTLGSSLVTATGGSAGGGCSGLSGGCGGAGSDGRIKLDYTNLSGTTSPTPGSTGTFPASIPGSTLLVNRQDGFGKILQLLSGGSEIFSVDSTGDMYLNSLETTGNAATISANQLTSGNLLKLSSSSLTTGNLVNLNTSLTTGNVLYATVSGITTGNLLSLNEAGMGNFSGNGIYLNFGQDTQNATSAGFIGNFLKFISLGATKYLVDSRGAVNYFGATNDDNQQINGRGFKVSNQGKTVITDVTNTLGNGADGACATSGTVILDGGGTGTTGNSCVGRTTAADAVNFSVGYFVPAGASTITVATTSASPTGLAVNDEVLIINLRGTPTDYANVGHYETRRITAISTKTLTLDNPLTYNFDGSTQAIMVQRVPNYTNVTISSGGTLTANAFSVTTGLGGVIFFRANGTITVDSGGVVSASGKGYAGGTGAGSTGGVTYNGVGGTGGNGVAGSSGQGGGAGNGTSSGSGASGTIGGAGGGGGIPSSYGGGGGGGGYGSVGVGGGPGNNGGGTAGGDGSGVTGGNGGNTTGTGAGGGGGGGGSYGQANLSSLYLGSGGGEGGKRFNNSAYAGGTGGGIVYIVGKQFSVSGSVEATGSAGQTIPGSTLSGAGGGGAGGSIYIKASSQTLGSSLVTAAGGAGGTGCSGLSGGCGGAGGTGRIRIDGSYTGTTSPTVGYSQPWSGYGDSPSLLVNKVDQGAVFAAQFNGAPIYTLDTGGSILATASSGFATLTLNQTAGGDLFAASASGINKFVISGSGNVGVGVSAPVFKLDLSDSQNATGVAQITNSSTNADADGLIVKLGFTGTGATTNSFLTFLDGNGAINGLIRSTGANGVAYQTSGIADLAEFMKFGGQKPEYGMVVCQKAGGIEPCDGEEAIIGVTSQYPNFVGGVETSDSVAVGFVGQVPVKISSHSASIRPGDVLVPDPAHPGYAMKATKSGYSVGKAVEGWNGTKQTALAYLNVGYFVVDSVTIPGPLPLSAWDNIDIGTISGDLKVIGKTQLADTSIGGSLSVGLLHFDDVKAEISSLTGQVTINSNLNVMGDASVSGQLNIGKGIVFQDTLTGESYCVQVTGGEIVREKGECN